MEPIHQTSPFGELITDAFASDWIDSWNARDLDRIVSHYREDLVLVSPFAARAGAPGGVIRGLPALREYFGRALQAFPQLHFEPFAALAGVDSVALHYRSVEGREAIEVMELDRDHRVRRINAHYGPPVAQDVP
jgi:SnoaL-like domain